MENQQQAIAIRVGDVNSNSAIVWARNSRNGKMLVNFSTLPTLEESLQTSLEIQVDASTDFTGTVELSDLDSNTPYYYQVSFVEADENLTKVSKSPIGKFCTAPSPSQSCSVRFVWVADMAGQGWGRNPNLKITAFDGEVIEGGFVVFDVLRKLKPDFAVFSGDMIYADNPIPPTKTIPASVGGGTWINNPSKDFIAISLDQFRQNWKYNLEDPKFANFLAETPIYAQWDDHEVVNNWYPNQVLTSPPYSGISSNALAERSKRAFFEYNPIRGKQIFRSYTYGRLLELFLLDQRSFRDSNDKNTESFSAMLGSKQLEWLKQEIHTSQSIWKIIAATDPISIPTGDGFAQGDSQILGREAELYDLLSFIKHNKIENVVWITADPHFPAAIFYDPKQAVFQDFIPFWEFVIGPIHAGAFGPIGNQPLDNSFGPQYEFKAFPSEPNLPPPNNQFFGSVDIDAQTAKLVVRIHKISGEVVYEKLLHPN